MACIGPRSALTAAFGYSSTDFEAAFNPASSAYEGNYECVIGGLRVRWICDGILQGAPTLSGPWTDIPGATSPYCTPASGPYRFFRTRN